MSAEGPVLGDGRIEQILDLLMRIAAGDTSARGEQSDRYDDLDAVILGVNMLAEEIGRKVAQTEQLAADLVAERDKVIQAQSETLRELSTPVIQVAEGVLVLPLVGAIDASRAQLISEALLGAITRHQAEVVIIDATGIPIIDTRVAQHLLESIMACRLLGARVILSGVQPHHAKTLVRLGVALDDVPTVPSLQRALAKAGSLTGDDSAS